MPLALPILQSFFPQPPHQTECRHTAAREQKTHEKAVDGESAGESIFYHDSSDGSEAEGEKLKERCKKWIKREIARWR